MVLIPCYESIVKHKNQINMSKTETKTHYRKVYKSDHLGVADLEELRETGHGKFVFVIDFVKQEYDVAVAGRKGDHNIAYFKKPKGVTIKPWVINAGNAKIIAGFAKSSFIEAWQNIPVELYIDENVKMKGAVVGGVRIRPVQPILQKKKPTFKMDNFEAAYEGGADANMIRRHYSLTPGIEDKYNKFVKSQDNEK